MHRSDFRLSERAGSSFVDDTQRIKPDTGLPLAIEPYDVLQESSHSGFPAPSSGGADSPVVVWNKSQRISPSAGPVRAVSPMSNGLASDWSDNERLSASLVSQIALGDEQAMARLYDITSAMVYGLGLRIVKDPSAAEEIALETYLQLWRSAENYDPARGTVTAWLLTMARSRALDWLRARKARRADLEQNLDQVFDLRDHGPSPESSSIQSGRARIIREAMADLPLEQRRALEMTYFAGLSHSEIALQTGLPIGTVKTRIRLGMLRLRELLGPYREGL